MDADELIMHTVRSHPGTTLIGALGYLAFCAVLWLALSGFAHGA